MSIPAPDGDRRRLIDGSGAVIADLSLEIDDSMESAMARRLLENARVAYRLSYDPENDLELPTLRVRTNGSWKLLRGYREIVSFWRGVHR